MSKDDAEQPNKTEAVVDEPDIPIDDGKVDLVHSEARYLGYSAALARGFRYLAFTSDFGEALRPIVSARIVTGTYAVALGYCVGDVAWEAYKLKKRGYLSELSHPMTMTQLIVERSTFQAIASIAVPFAVIHSAVAVAKKGFTRFPRYARYGPTIVGLSIIPFLPMYLDEPIERAIEWAFEKHGPWAQQHPHGYPKKE